MLTQTQLDAYKPWLISVVKKGSSVLPWIKNPRDKDYIFYVTDNTCSERLVEVHKLQPKEECWLFDTFDNCHARVYSYQDNFSVPIYGTNFPQFDIFKNKEQYKQRLVSHGLNKTFNSRYKGWYHILTGIYMLNNGSYDLTPEQAENVRLCHDRMMTSEIYNYIQTQLSEYEKELKS